MPRINHLRFLVSDAWHKVFGGLHQSRGLNAAYGQRDWERFEELIKQKKLTAKVTHGKHSTDVALTGSPKEIVEVLKIEKGLFKYKEPLVLKRLTK